jgi:hypothetical protein
MTKRNRVSRKISKGKPPPKRFRLKIFRAFLLMFFLRVCGVENKFSANQKGEKVKSQPLE